MGVLTECQEADAVQYDKENPYLPLLSPLTSAPTTKLTRLSAGEGVPANEMAVRLLRRALRAKRPKPVWDSEAIRSHAASFAEEDARLAESDLSHRATLLLNEDNAEESDGFVGVIDTNTLMQRPGGAVWWKANGYQVRGEFDLSSNSPMSQLLADYLDENQVVVI